MKVAIINPPQVFAKTQIAASVTPPLGPLYLASAIRREGHKVSVLDAIVEAPDQITEIKHGIQIRGFNFTQIADHLDEDTQVIGVSNLFSFAFPVVIELIDKLKERFPEARIVLGGAHPSALPEQSLKDTKADFVIMGEGEASFIKLLNAFENNDEGLDDIGAMAYKKDGKIVTNSRKDYIENIDQLLFPARDLVDWDKYFAVHEAHGPIQERWTPILSSRGCPFECTFCTSKLWDRRFRVRTPENVVEEIEHCIKEYGITEFHFEDENLTLNKKRIQDICKLIIEKGIKIKWQTPNGIRASVTSFETLDLMKAAGCYHITVAPESGSENVLTLIKKRQNLEKVGDIIEHAYKIGLKTAAYFIIGLPGETKEDIKMSIKYACLLAKRGLDEVAFSNFIPLPGSELFDMLHERGVLKDDWFSYTSIGDISKSVSWSEHITSDELQKLRKKAYLSFHFTKGIYYPGKVIHSIANILRKKEELKTEKALIAIIKRFKNRKELTPQTDVSFSENSNSSENTETKSLKGWELATNRHY